MLIDAAHRSRDCIDVFYSVVVAADDDYYFQGPAF